ncbi:hypothetical protein ACN47E_004226 [Coniothyrium glycines]
MSGPNLDPNQWYHLYVTSGPGQGLIGNNPPNNDATSGVWFNPTNITKPNFRWQVFQLNETTWTLRCNESGPNRYLAAGYFAAEDTDGHTRPYLARGDIADASAYWTLSPWGDGTFYMWNAANTSDYRMMKKGSGTMAMSGNITAPQAGQRWQFDKIAEINDAQYSTVSLIGAMTSTSAISSLMPTTTSPTTSPTITTSIPAASSGLSTGAKAAIGASVGVAVLIVLVVLSLFLNKKRKQKHAYAPPVNVPIYEAYVESAPPLAKYEMYHGGTERYEVPAQVMVEADVNERPAELPGTELRR